MPGCSAVKCSNSSEKGFLMKRFPKNRLRRKEWLIKMKRDNWEPTDHSCLCEVHFAPEMWEKTRVDGTRKLKGNAVPTIFFFSPPPPPKRKSPRRKLPDIKSVINKASTSAENVENLSTEVDVGAATTSALQPCVESVSPSGTHTSSTTSPDQSEEDIANIALNEKIKKYENLYLRERKKAMKYKRYYRNARKKIKSLSANTSHNLDLLKTLFNEDQMFSLKKKASGKSTKFMKWSSSTVTKSLKLKFSCGTSGYEQLIKDGFPLPSIRTLQRRLQNLKFDSGILTEVFEFLSLKVQSFNDHQRDCMLVLDEAAITVGKQYDSSLNKYFGEVTLPGHTGMATHVLVFMLGGINTRWKQVVAYYFTGNSVNGQLFDNIIKEIFNNTKKIGLNIVSVTSDMGGSNQALWRTWDIHAGRHSEINFKIQHPLTSDSSIYVFADVPHLFKNIKSMLISNKIILLPDDICVKNNLPTREVRAQHLHELVKHQDNCCFQLAPKLSEEDLLPSHFNKMKVGTSTNVISHSVSSALKFLSEELDKKEYLATAFFLDQVEKWFYILTSRHPSSALSRHNENIYQDTITFLNDFIDLFRRMEVGYKKIWKPSQSGVLITTNSMLELHKKLLDEKNYEFVLTSRFSQDCLENLFAILRSKQIVPNALQVKNNLKLICVAQYLKEATTGSYSEDERTFLSGFLETLSQKKLTYKDVIVPKDLPHKSLNLNYSELNSLYNICGYIICSIQKTSKVCSNCLNSIGSKKPLYKKYAKFVLIKQYKNDTLFFASEELFHFFLEMEIIFKKYIEFIQDKNVNVKEFYFTEMEKLQITSIPTCHNLKNKIIRRYIVFRLRTYFKKIKAKGDKYASKSVAGHNL